MGGRCTGGCLGPERKGGQLKLLTTRGRTAAVPVALALAGGLAATVLAVPSSAGAAGLAVHASARALAAVAGPGARSNAEGTSAARAVAGAAAVVGGPGYSCASPVYARSSQPAGSPVHAEVSFGGVRAVLTGTGVKGDGGGLDVLANPVLRVTAPGRLQRQWPVGMPAGVTVGPRNGVTLASLRPGRDLPLCVATFDGPRPETAVLVGMYSGGAHCCTWLSAYPVMPASLVLSRPVQQDLTDPGGIVASFRGRAMLVSADDRFAYRFDSYAGSALPLRVLDLQDNRFVDVTRRHKPMVRAEAAGLWETYRKAQGGGLGEGRGGGLGVLAAWVADECLLGQGPAAWATVAGLERRGLLSGGNAGSFWPTGAKYVSALRSFLRATGYC